VRNAPCGGEGCLRGIIADEAADRRHAGVPGTRERARKGHRDLFAFLRNVRGFCRFSAVK
jgi:hypothetical protein